MPYFGVSAKTFGFEATAKDTFSGDDSTVAFTLSQTSATNDVEVFVGNVQQEPTVAYSISGSTLTFTEAPPTGTNNIYVLHRSRTRDTILPPADLGDKNYLMSGGLRIADGGNIGSASDSDAISISSTGDVTLTQDLKIKDGGTIGSASDADAISIASTGDITLTQNLKVKDGGTIGSASDADAITIASDGKVTLAEVVTVSKGIKFPATQVASTDANTLDEYEEGTFTPTITSGGTSITYVLQRGSYVKFGKLVEFQIDMYMTAGTANGNNLRIGGLPFTSANQGKYAFCGAFFNYNNAAFCDLGDRVLFHIVTTNTYMQLYNSITGNVIAGTSTGVNIFGSKEFTLTGIYQAS